jgi:tetratricopeptide (TPR) repeat protein
MFCHKAGDLNEAVKLYRRALRRTTEPSDIFDSTRVAVALGHALAALGRFDEAERALREAVEKDPRNVVAHANHAVLLRRLGHRAAAEAACRAALIIDNAFVPALHTLGTIQTDNNRLTDAEGSFVRVLALDPRHIQALVNLSAICSATDRMDEAVALLERAISINPRIAEAHVNLGIILSEMGRTKAAIVSLRTAIEIDPDNVEAWYALSAAGEADLTRNEAERLVRLADSGRVSDDQRTKLYFTLAAAAERNGNIVRAFSDFQLANSLRKTALERAGRGFDPDKHARMIDELILAAPKESFAATGKLGEGLVFIVGLPRSGTTLVEQILAAHPDAVSIGECDDIAHLATKAENGDATAPAGAHVEAVRAKVPGARVIVDKTPFNYLHLAAIARLLPGARIIHIRRDVRDVALSCFTQNFVTPHAWSCDLGHLGDYIRQYERMMAHWRAALPAGRMIEIDYEALVADPAAEAKRIVAFADLEWTQACLEFHRAKGVVRTASKWQVRKPIYASSVGRWQAFRPFLGPLLARLL